MRKCAKKRKIKRNSAQKAEWEAKVEAENSTIWKFPLITVCQYGLCDKAQKKLDIHLLHQT